MNRTTIPPAPPRTPLQPSLYDAIFHRRSIRRFDMTPLPIDLIGAVRAFAASAIPLDSSIRVEFVVRHEADVRNLLPNEAPHYLCLYSERKGPYLMNAGYLLQQVDLHLSSTGLGSCWLGIAKPNGKTVPSAPTKAELHGLDFVIMLAFGRPAVPLHRTSPAEFARQGLPSIADLPSLSGFIAASGLSAPADWLEPVRLAPSATNSQPWHFSGDGDALLVSRERLGLLREPFMGRMNQIDIGIALCHLDLSLSHCGRSAMFDFTKTPAPEGFEAMARVRTGKEA
jgi:nitroreductase